ncbi:MAG: hypothetical protein AAFY63_15300 [Cyanobacteria bacterium J06643_13]
MSEVNKANNLRGEIKIQSSILSRAVTNDSEALFTMFKQFIPDSEKIYYTQYLGRQGLWFIGTYSFACLTDRRVADISVGAFGEVVYQDGYLEFVNSSVIYQPSKLGLYLLVGFWLFFIFIITSVTYNFLYLSFAAGVSAFVSLVVFLLFILLTPFIVKAYYGLVKCGIVFWVREGVPLYIFSNRRYLKRANWLCRGVTSCRERRLKDINGKPNI